MKVPFLDLHACFDPLRGEIFNQLEGVFDRCDFVLGKPVKDFEEAVRDYCGVKYALGVASGTDALIIALRAAGIGAGDAVITTPFTFIATAESIWAAGACPVFCDISASTYNLDPDQVKDFTMNGCVTGQNGELLHKSDNIKAILPVHLFGLMADMPEFMDLSRKYGLKIIEDAAQSFGAKIKTDGLDNGSDGGFNGIAGAVGDVGCFSFYPSKNLGGAGDGGMIVSDSAELFEKAEVLHVHGGKKKYFHEEFGYNSRLDSMQAALLLVKLRRIDKWIDMRRKNASHYNALFLEKLGAAGIEVITTGQVPRNGDRPENAIIIPTEPENYFHTFNTYEIRIPNRDEAQKYLIEKGIGCAIYYPLPLHQQKIFDYLDCKKGDFPVTEKICNDILALPQYPELPRDCIEYTVETVIEFLKGN